MAARIRASPSAITYDPKGQSMLQHFLQQDRNTMRKSMEIMRKNRTTCSIHHRSNRKSNMLIYIHFYRKFKLLRSKVAAQEYAPLSPDSPLFDDSTHTT